MKRNNPILMFLIFAFGIPLPCSLLIAYCPLFQGAIGCFLLLGIASLEPILALKIEQYRRIMYNKAKIFKFINS